MIPRRLLFVVFALLGVILGGCAPQWAVVSQAIPNPLVGEHKFAVAPTDWSILRVGEKSEAEYLAGKDDKEKASFASDKDEANGSFTNAMIAAAHGDGVEVVLATGPADAKYFVRPTVTFFEPGFYVGVASGASRLDVNVKVTTADGNLVDEVLFTHRSAAPTMGGNQGALGALMNIDKMSSGGRMKADGEWIGKTVAKYLRTRVTPNN